MPKKAEPASQFTEAEREDRVLELSTKEYQIYHRLRTKGLSFDDAYFEVVPRERVI